MDKQAPMNKLFLKSSEQMSEIEDNSIRLIVTSPPYFNIKDYGMEEQIGKKSHSYEHYIESMIPVWKECYRILKPNGKLCVNSPIMPMEKKAYSTHYNRDILNINNDIEASILQQTAFFRYGQVIWDKGSTDQLMMGSYPFPPNFYFLNHIEFINVFVKDGQPEKISAEVKEQSKLSKEEWREYISPIWRFAPENDRRHPAPFPLELPKRLIRMFSFANDIIVDPFMGSGTTAAAALLTGRRFIGYEINPEYITLAHQRLESFKQEQLFTKAANGKKADFETLEILRKLIKPEFFNEELITGKLSGGETTQEILADLYNRRR